jgi:hypothetical protein
MVHSDAVTCNPCYLGGGDKKVEVQDQPGQKVSRTLISTNKPGMVACVCNLSYLVGMGSAWPAYAKKKTKKTIRSFLKNN